MQKIQLGTKVKALGISRSNVADGQTGRAVLLDPNPRFKYIAYDDKLKRRVEVNQDMVIKYGLSPITYYFYLIGRLNTDLNGNVVGTKMVVEYLQLTESVNNEFADSIRALKGFSQLILNKVSKKGNNGTDYGYIKPIPSQEDLDPEITANIQKLRDEPGAIDAMWMLIDRNSSITPAEYEELKNNPQLPQGQGYAQMPAPQQRQQIAASAPQPSMPQAVEGFGEEFGEGSEFNDF